MNQVLVSQYVVPRELAAILRPGWITRDEQHVPIWWEREPIKMEGQGVFQCGRWERSLENWHSLSMTLAGIKDELLPPIGIPWEQCKFQVTVEVKRPRPEIERDNRMIRVRVSTEMDAETAVRLQVPPLGTPHPTKHHLLLVRREVHQPRLSKWYFFSSEYESLARLCYANCDAPLPPDRNPPLLINDYITHQDALKNRLEIPIEIHDVKRIESAEGCKIGGYMGYWRGKTVTFNTSAGTYEGRVDVENNDDPVCIVNVGCGGGPGFYSVAKSRYMREYTRKP